MAALFAEVVGQPRAVQALRAAARDPVHAYLFCGAEGHGTRAAARAFAAALLCPDGGCGHCATCHRALAGTHPDLVTVERTGASLGVDEARRLVGLAQRRPFEASRQVLVVTDLHLAVRSAPALLKTIEEPPASTVFVLLADAIPPELVTVASRCVEVEFPPVPTGVIARWLEDRGVPAQQAAPAAEGAAGDLGRAALVAEDPDFADRLALWRSVPGVLDGHGATAGDLARQLLGRPTPRWTCPCSPPRPSSRRWPRRPRSWASARSRGARRSSNASTVRSVAGAPTSYGSASGSWPAPTGTDWPRL